jgi:hypothetical protein
MVMFTRRYNEEAHNLCASQGLAPKLLLVDRDVIFGWAMVVTQHVDSITLLNYIDIGVCDDRDQVRDDIMTCLRLLHDRGLVFGNHLPTNILINKKGCGMLFGFDWAGEAGTNRYPYHLNKNIEWPAGVEENGIMEKAHDIYWLNKIQEQIYQ